MDKILDMGGYAVYVWTSYGVALAILYAHVIAIKVQYKRMLEELREASEDKES